VNTNDPNTNDDERMTFADLVEIAGSVLVLFLPILVTAFMFWISR